MPTLLVVPFNFCQVTFETRGEFITRHYNSTMCMDLIGVHTPPIALLLINMVD